MEGFPAQTVIGVQQRQRQAWRQRQYCGRIDPPLGQHNRRLYGCPRPAILLQRLPQRGSSWTWPENPSTAFHSPNISGSQRQPNGNTSICEGASGHLFEITPEGESVWEYITAYSQFGAPLQGDNPLATPPFAPTDMRLITRLSKAAT